MFGFQSQKVSTDEKKIEEILTRGTEDIFVEEHLKAALLSGKQLRVKLGIDPTSPSIHLGRAVVLRKLKAFQDLGHQAVLIIGDFTAKIADPSDKLEKRPMLTDEEIKKNLSHYLTQIGKIIDLKKTEVRYNSEWLSSMNVFQVGELLEVFTAQQMLRRRNFHERIENGQDIFVVELMYPALQGYDSLKVKADVELGGFDQLFNLKAGRTVQKRYGAEEQDVMTVQMLPGTDGRKMSSSWGNVISLLDTASDMFGKVLALRDELIIKYFTLCTDLSFSEIAVLEKKLTDGVNPKDIKTQLAYEIVRMYHGETEAQKAKENFENTFAKGGVPDEIQEVTVGKGMSLMEVFGSSGTTASNSEFRRLIGEGAITLVDADKKITDPNAAAEPGTYKIGKRRFLKINI